jgi:hypothetical protein
MPRMPKTEGKLASPAPYLTPVMDKQAQKRENIPKTMHE